MASPTSDPFVRFSKELYDALLRAPLPAGRLLVCLVVVRLTDGDHARSEAPVSLGTLEKATGRSRSALKADLDDLMKEGVLRELRPPSAGRPRIIALNRNCESWGRYRVDVQEIPAFLRHDWEKVCGSAHEYLRSAPEGTGRAHPPVPGERTEPYRPAAPTKEENLKTKRKISQPKAFELRLTASPETDWKERAEALLSESAFGPELRRLAELLAAANKTGKVTLRRVVTTLYEPLTELERQVPAEALRYGFAAALAAGAANATYVEKAVRTYLRPKRAPDVVGLGGAAARSTTAGFFTNGGVDGAG
jgi:hypothetical protein